MQNNAAAEVIRPRVAREEFSDRAQSGGWHLHTAGAGGTEGGKKMKPTAPPDNVQQLTVGLTHEKTELRVVDVKKRITHT